MALSLAVCGGNGGETTLAAICTSAAEAAAKVGGKLIGVDQASVLDATYGEGMNLTSAMKALVKAMLDGEILVSNDTTTMPQTAITVNTHANIK